MSLLHKAYPTTHTKIAPNDSDLEMVSKFAMDAVTPDSVFMGRMKLCNDQVDRSGERFPIDYLERFKSTIVGKSVMPGHNYAELPLGRFYDADVVKQDGIWHLVPKYYLAADDPITGKVKSGIARDVSIGFRADKRVCDLCERDYDGYTKGEEDYCPHVALQHYDEGQCTVSYGGDAEKAEAVEGSFVWLGCQYGAEVVANGGPTSHVCKAAFIAQEKGERRLWNMAFPYPFHPHSFNSTTSGDPALKGKTMGDDPTKGAQGLPPDHVAIPAKELAELRGRAKAGEAYIVVLKERITSRYASLDLEETGKSLVEDVEDVEKLEKWVKEADAKFAKQFPPSPHGNPDTPPPPPAENSRQRGFDPWSRRRRSLVGGS